jgi:hypothetical protein
MIRVLRTGIFLLLLLAVGTSPALAAFVPGCANPADSALNQYCETIPGAAGAQPPHPGTPALPPHAGTPGASIAVGARAGAGIAHSTGSQANARQARERAVSSRPRGPAGATVAPATNAAAKTSASPIPLWLPLLLAALALALTGAAIVGWRHKRRAGPSGQAPA